jgi:hypothetical protein
MVVSADSTRVIEPGPREEAIGKEGSYILGSGGSEL